MIQRILTAALAVGLAGGVACGNGVQVRTQAAPNFSTVGRTTFRLLPTPPRAGNFALDSDDPMLSSSITNEALRNDIVRDLEARGYQRVQGNHPADLDVAYYASTREALDIRTYNYGYTWRRWPRDYTEVTRYERGTVIVDLVDPRSRELLWRGQGSAQVSENPNRYVNELGKVVGSIVRKVPEASTH
jgi:hypothetical protein